MTDGSTGGEGSLPPSEFPWGVEQVLGLYRERYAL